MSLFGCGTSPAAVQPYFEISLESQLERLSDIKKPHLLIDLLIASKEKPLFLDPRTISSLFTKSLSPININDQDKNGQTLLYKIVNQIIKSESDFDLYELFIPNLLDFYPEIDSLKADKDPILLLLNTIDQYSGSKARLAELSQVANLLLSSSFNPECYLNLVTEKTINSNISQEHQAMWSDLQKTIITRQDVLNSMKRDFWETSDPIPRDSYHDYRFFT